MWTILIQLSCCPYLFNLKCVHSHRAGKDLGPILSCNCTTEKLMVRPLHVSDHNFITFSERRLEHPTIPPPAVLFRCNLRSLSSNEILLGCV